ncbi:helix-turn-helix domain-containing protein [Enterococcus casseliflavus]|uniref:helix-turn-helix domain-containing protein n=1 Tax=Enterococcus casseliflavus TaxID=37734 RepID=UPI00232D6BF0|nr:helix-turn-helix transcriptional regulator [Enterococcus casseliflavus]MDB1687471.1 helix-turn-helix transcriptional regulator [Enterococcus casseliflavus]
MIEISLRSARVNAGLTLKDAAGILNIHHETLSKYEADSSEISIGLLNRLSDLYQIPTDNIFLGNRYELIRTIRENSSYYVRPA